MKLFKHLKLIFSLILLVACGGGGGGGGGGNSGGGSEPTPGPTPAPTPAPAPERYSISGTVSLAADVIIDSDVPNKAFSYLSNNSIAEAQPAFDPVSVLGYAGRFTDSEGDITDDSMDVFVLNIENKQINVTLRQVNSDSDLDLYAYSSDDLSNPLVFSTGSGSTEQVSINGNGVFYISITADLNLNGSKYALIVEEQASTSSFTTSSARQSNKNMSGKKFDTGEFIIMKKDKSIEPSVDEKKLLKQVFGVDYKFNRARLVMPSYENIKRYKPLKTIEDSTREFGISQGDILEVQKIKAIEYLRDQLPNYFIEFNHIYYPDADPIPFSPDPFYNDYQWNLRQIKTKEALDLIGQDTKDVIVAVLDSGAPSKDSLAWINSSFVEDGYDFVRSTDSSFDGDGIDNDPTDPDFLPVNSSGNVEYGSHGSHVATTISAKNDGNEINGLASKTLPLRVCGSDQSENGGGCSGYDQLQAFYYVQGKENDSGEIYDASQYGAVSVINMSLGGGGSNEVICEEIKNLKDNGIYVVASAGNEGNSAIRFPASCEFAFSVASTKADQRKSSFSSYNDFVDIAAPGGQTSEDYDGNDIGDGVMAYSFKNSSYDGTDYKGLQLYQGTSMAAPHVSGYFALLRFLDSDLTYEEINLLLKSEKLTNDVGPAGKDEYFGYGLMDLNKGISFLREGVNYDLLSYAEFSPARVNLGYSLNERIFEIKKYGNGSLSVSDFYIVSSGVPAEQKLSVESVSVDENGFGQYKATIDRNGLSNGNTILRIEFLFNDGRKAEIPVLMQNGDQKIKATVDQLWICAVNDQNQIQPCDVMQMTNGTANYRVRELPNDTYTEIFACTTLEDRLSFSDQGICGLAELEGQYLNNIVINGSNVNDINFNINPNLSF